MLKYRILLNKGAEPISFSTYYRTFIENNCVDPDQLASLEAS